MWISIVFNTVCAKENLIGGVMVSFITSSVLGSGFETRTGNAKDYNIAVASPQSTER
jgi:hypothetical protein